MVCFWSTTSKEAGKSGSYTSKILYQPNFCRTMKRIVQFLLQAAVLGLAFAFVLVWFRPGLIRESDYLGSLVWIFWLA